MDFDTYIRMLADGYLIEGAHSPKWIRATDDEKAAAWKLILPLLDGQIALPHRRAPSPAAPSDRKDKAKTRR